MVFTFEYVPRDGITFIDTSALLSESADDYHKVSIPRELVWTRDLRKFLSSTSCWATIPEVVEELRRGILGLKTQQNQRHHKPKFNPYAGVAEETTIAAGIRILRKERARLVHLLVDNDATAPDAKSPELLEKVAYLEPKVRQVFGFLKGNRDPSDKLVKLITCSLAYAQMEQPRGIPVYLWTNSSAMYQTYEAVALREQIVNAFRISSRLREVVKNQIQHMAS